MNDLGSLPMALVIGGDWLYTTEKYLATDLDPIDFSPAHHLFNGRLVIKDDDDHWAMQLFVSNILTNRFWPGLPMRLCWRGNISAAPIAAARLR